MKRNMPATGDLLVSPNTFSRSRDDLAGLAGLQREHAHRHALQPVDVEDLDRPHVVFELGARAADGDDVARVVGGDDRVGARVGRQHLLHLLGGDEAQRHDARLVTARERGRTGARRDRAGERGIGGDDVVAPVGVHHARVVPAQHLFEQRHRLRRAHRARRGQRHRALHARRDHVVLAEHVAEDRLHHRVQRFAFEVERRRARTATEVRRRRARRAAVDDFAAAALELRCGRALGGVAFRRRAWWSCPSSVHLRARQVRLDDRHAAVAVLADRGHRLRGATGQRHEAGGDRERREFGSISRHGSLSAHCAGVFWLFCCCASCAQLRATLLDAAADRVHLLFGRHRGVLERRTGLLRHRVRVGRGGRWRHRAAARPAAASAGHPC